MGRRATVAAATSAVPVIEVGGTHVTAALVDPAAARVVPGSALRQALDAGGSAHEILTTVADTASAVADRTTTGAAWGVAIPGPFDYDRGIGRFRGVAKLDALDGVDVRHELIERIGRAAGRIVFVNDADAFGLGESFAGAAAGHRRVVAITLGTGIGSAFLDGHTIVDHGAAVPPEGRLDLLTIHGEPLEETVSRRAILRRFEAATGSGSRDVHDVADLARDGDPAARRVLDEAFVALGIAVAPWLGRFEATCLVVGGAMSGAWDLIEPPLRDGLARSDVVVVKATLPDEAALIGAAMRVLEA